MGPKREDNAIDPNPNDDFFKKFRLEVASILSGDKSLDKKLSTIFREITGRTIKERELETLKRSYREEKEKFSKNPSKAIAYLKTGEKPINRKAGIINTAALATVISGMMNTAEAITIN